jgi:hypothetical protein
VCRQLSTHVDLNRTSIEAADGSSVCAASFHFTTSEAAMGCVSVLRNLQPSEHCLAESTYHSVKLPLPNKPLAGSGCSKVWGVIAVGKVDGKDREQVVLREFSCCRVQVSSRYSDPLCCCSGGSCESATQSSDLSSSCGRGCLKGSLGAFRGLRWVSNAGLFWRPAIQAPPAHSLTGGKI